MAKDAMPAKLLPCVHPVLQCTHSPGHQTDILHLHISPLERTLLQRGLMPMQTVPSIFTAVLQQQ